jgi:hypothetical protein
MSLPQQKMQIAPAPKIHENARFTEAMFGRLLLPY